MEKRVNKKQKIIYLISIESPNFKADLKRTRPPTIKFLKHLKSSYTNLKINITQCLKV